MRSELLRLLLSTTIATSIAVVLVGFLRRPLRNLAGARVGYWIWLVIPAALVGCLLPSPRGHVLSRTLVVASHLVGVVETTVSRAAPGNDRTYSMDAALALWAAGFIVLSIATVRRQRTLAPILCSPVPDSNNCYRGYVEVPMIVGVWRPKIIVPQDFEARYSRHEQELILAHERAHESRNDVAANLMGSIAVCVYWFNPLMFRALGWLRMDQELACDALVLSMRGESRRQYAETLLRTQLVAESAWRLPLGCAWNSIHPLKERVAMLKRPNPAKAKRAAGMAFIAGVAAAAAYAVWAAEPAASDGQRVWIDYKIRMTNPESPNFLIDLNTRYVVASGETINDDKDGKPLLHAGEWRLGCTPYLPAYGSFSGWSDQKARGIPLPAPGQILLECSIQHNGGNVQSFAALAKDGSPAIMDVAEPGSALQYHLEVIPSSTMPENFIDHLTLRPAQPETPPSAHSER